MKKWKVILMAALMVFAVSGCSKDANIDSTSTPGATTENTPGITPGATTNNETATPSTPAAPAGKAQSKLTGEWIDEAVAARRPYAVMINNIEYAAQNHSGIGQAGIIYECLVEGGITRLMAIFDEFDSDRIGSVRSARHYFVSIADEYDAMFVHYGQTGYALDKIAELGVDNLSGLEGVGSTVFYRDNNLKAPHNAFASYEGIIKGTEQKKYRTEYRDNVTSHYDFNAEDTVPVSDTVANKVSLAFSAKKVPYFEYDSEAKMYSRFQFGDKHMDVSTNTQLAFKNIIVQYVKEWNIDDNGYQTMDLENASGDGIYVSDGKCINITWKKNENDKTMSYYDQSGNKLSVNKGKTYIALFPNDRVDSVVVE